MNLISKVLVGSAMSGSLLTGCIERKPASNYSNFMDDRPYAEHLEIKSKIRDGAFYEDSQRYLDSIAFRDVFNSTEAAKHPAVVADFDKIANNTAAKITSHHQTIGGLDREVSPGSLLDKFKNLNITNRNFNKIKDSYWGTQELQYYVDSVAYSNFFERHNLMNDSVKKQIKAICKKIRP